MHYNKIMIEYILIFFVALNSIFLIMLSNFVIKLADSIKIFTKDLEDFYYLKNNPSNISKNNSEESGLVDV